MNHKDKHDRGQVNRTAADIYEEFFLPALFQEWTDRVADAAQVQAGDHVLDVACGTGVLARTVATRIANNGSGARVVGLDVNEGMLAIAARKAPDIDWRHGRAEDLPFDTDSFDAVVSQFGLMFFEDREAAIREMVRVLRPGGRIAVAVWDALENTPGYAAMVDLLQQLFGEEAAHGLRVPYILGDKTALQKLFARAGLPQVAITTHRGTARYPSVKSWVYTDVYGWVLMDVLDETQVDRLVAAAEQALARFVQPDGSVMFDAPAHIISATKA
ncbi:MAG: methyltransferase domain-containing protein [Chloroflexi bacterium]|nr:methyltransferase domain-containing protein [Chloroflexota bacterium]